LKKPREERIQLKARDLASLSLASLSKGITEAKERGAPDHALVRLLEAEGASLTVMGVSSNIGSRPPELFVTWEEEREG
jgi:hypothetical protein